MADLGAYDPAGPAVVVLAGAAGSGKSTWAERRFLAAEIVSSDALRAVVGTGPADLDASIDAFVLLDQILDARTRRGLTTVVDTLGLEPARRRDYLDLARRRGLRAHLVVLDTPAALCRARNRRRDRPVPATVLTDQLKKVRAVVAYAPQEGWDEVHVVDAIDDAGEVEASPVSATPLPPAPAEGFSVILQLSRFPWGEDPAGWLRDLAATAAQVGFDGIALMDHLIQIPQVDRAWEPIPQPWVTLGLLAGLDQGLRLGTLVSPVTFHHAGVLAKTVATLDALSGGRAFCGLGAGWWVREHQAFGLDFPGPAARLDALQACIETMRALWSPGTKPYAGRFVNLPETTCYPRPVGPVRILVGGSGARTLRIAAEQADGCNVPSDDAGLSRVVETVRAHSIRAGRDPDEVAITVLDLPILGTDREDVARRVERLRGRTPAPVFAARHHAGLAVDHARRYADLATRGVRTAFLALPDLDRPADLERCAPLLAQMRDRVEGSGSPSK